jgi:hypothetical protein
MGDRVTRRTRPDGGRHVDQILGRLTLELASELVGARVAQLAHLVDSTQTPLSGELGLEHRPDGLHLPSLDLGALVHRPHVGSNHLCESRSGAPSGPSAEVCVAYAGVGADLGGPTRRDDLASIEDEQVRADSHDQFHVVLDQQDGHAPNGELGE